MKRTLCVPCQRLYMLLCLPLFRCPSQPNLWGTCGHPTHQAGTGPTKPHSTHTYQQMCVPAPFLVGLCRNLAVAQQALNRVCAGCSRKNKALTRHTMDNLNCPTNIKNQLMQSFKAKGPGTGRLLCCSKALPTTWKSGSSYAARLQSFQTLSVDYGCSGLDGVDVAKSKDGSQKIEGAVECAPGSYVHMCVDV